MKTKTPTTTASGKTKRQRRSKPQASPDALILKAVRFGWICCNFGVSLNETIKQTNSLIENARNET